MQQQPPHESPNQADVFYWEFANSLMLTIEKENLLPRCNEGLLKSVALALCGYLQDISIDSGIWRSFAMRHFELYGKYIPFYEVSADYIPYELNPEDVRFLIWYTIALNSHDELRLLDPLDKEVERAAGILHTKLNDIYEDGDTPSSDDYHISRGLELGNPAEADDVFRFGHWLFMYCWLMTPAYSMTLAELLTNPELNNGRNIDLFRKSLEESMMEDPTGPLALYLREWLFLIIESKMPPEPKNSEEDSPAEHPYYTKFIAATGGSPIKFFKTYSELNHFFAEALGWGNGENLPALKHSSDFVLLVNRSKGMLCAKDVARCIRLEGNDCYDADYAREHAIDLLTVRGLCPADLLLYLFAHNALPDARFPGSDNTNLVDSNRDFIARCYLQKYYRGD